MVGNEFMIPINGQEWIARSLTGYESFTLQLRLGGSSLLLRSLVKEVYVLLSGLSLKK